MFEWKVVFVCVCEYGEGCLFWIFFLGYVVINEIRYDKVLIVGEGNVEYDNVFFF